MRATAKAARAGAGAEIVTGSGEPGVDAGAVAAFEVATAHSVFGLDLPNDRLDNGAAAYFTADRGGDTTHLVAGPDAELLHVVVAGAVASSALR
jgi:hypothetical protein